MDTGQFEVRVLRATKHSPSQGLANSIIILVDEIFDTGRAVSTPVIINLHRSNRHYIRELLQDELRSHCWWLSENLETMISEAATELGFGRNGFTMTISVKIAHQTDDDPDLLNNNNTYDEAILRMCRGMIDRKGLKCLKMETEPCSICLNNLSSSDSKPTRMTCSHVFHRRCLLEWLQRKNTCPLCRTVLYDHR